jgi:hypothetical protein
MTLIRRAGPWEDLFTLRRAMERLFDHEPALDITTNSRISAGTADTQPAPELVGAGSRR